MLYKKDNQIKSANDIIIIKDGMQTINPSHEMLLADGWEEYVVTKTLEEVRQKKLAELIAYDKESREINEFYLNGVGMWYDASKRSTIKNLVESNIKVGNDTVTLWTEEEPIMPITINCEQALLMLAQLEVYAGNALNVTRQHQAAIMALDSIEAIEAYDYTTSYPEKLNLSTN